MTHEELIAMDRLAMRIQDLHDREMVFLGRLDKLVQKWHACVAHAGTADEAAHWTLCAEELATIISAQRKSHRQ
jgi:hypothetical protein